MYYALSNKLGRRLAGFNPLSLSPSLWLDASDANTLYDATVGGSLVAANGAIARWEDKSGNARHATQSTGVSQPLRKTAIQNGKDVVRFDGANDKMATSAFNKAAALSVFIVTKANDWNPSAYKTLISQGYAADPNTSGMIIYGSAVASVDWFTNGYMTVGSGYNIGQNPRAHGAAAAGSDFRLMTTQLSNTIARVFINGSDVSTVETTGNCVIQNEALYISDDTFGNVWDGDISEILVYPTALGTDDRTAVEAYLNAKYAIY